MMTCPEAARVLGDSPRTLVNWVGHSDKIAPWTFGVSALMRNLAARGLI